MQDLTKIAKVLSEGLDQKDGACYCHWPGQGGGICELYWVCAKSGLACGT